MENSEDPADYKIGGYHPVRIGEVYYERYQIIEKIGFGYFSTVWLCNDLKNHEFVALKIQKSGVSYMEAAMDEIDIINKVHRNTSNPKWLDGENNHIVKISSHFMHRGPNGNHVCIAFEVLGANLVQLMHYYNFKGVPIETCKNIIKQSLIALNYLHRICGVIHTDIKPENILLTLSEGQVKELKSTSKISNIIPHVHEKIYTEMQKEENPCKAVLNRREKKKIHKRLKKDERKARRGIKDPPVEVIISRIDPNLNIKIIDFGNACWTTKHYCEDIQTLHYRSPEVILGIPYNFLADVWSLGCVLFELITGTYFLNPKSEENTAAEGEILSQVLDIMGAKNFFWGVKGKNANKYLRPNGSLKGSVGNLKNLSEILRNFVSDPEECKQIEGLLTIMLSPDPRYRASAAECLVHPWMR